MGTAQHGEWVQADLGRATHVYRVATQGMSGADQWVISYWLATSMSGEEGDFEVVVLPTGGLAFLANFDRDSVVTNSFSPRVARSVRLLPRTWTLNMSLRWEVYGCATGKYKKYSYTTPVRLERTIF